MYWTITYSGTERTLEEWGITQPNCHFENQGADHLTFSIPSEEGFDAPPTFPEDSVLTLRTRDGKTGAVWQGGRIWFVGRVVSPDRLFKTETQQYVVAGPWNDLEEIVYRQSWLTDGGGLPTSAVFLNYGKNQAQQITHVLDWAANNAGAILQAGSIGVAAPLLPSQDMDRMCSEIIRNQLRITPDTAVYFDYNALPYPSLNIIRRADMPAVTLTPGPGFSESQIRERHDLLLPCVLLNFRYTTQLNGRSKIFWTQQKFPVEASGLARRTLVHTFDLEGISVSTETTEIECEPVNADHATDSTRLAWWKAHIPFLNDTGAIKANSLVIKKELVKFTCPDDEEFSIEDYPNELVYGSMPPWLMTQQNVGWREIEVSCWVDFVAIDRDGVESDNDSVTREITFRMRVTNAVSGVYSTVKSVMQGETAPVGMAEYIYNSHKDLQYQGTIPMVSEEVLGTVRPGMVVNLVTKSGRFLNMRAMVQAVDEDIFYGRTTITIGPATHLGPDDIIQYLKGFRSRKLWENPAVQDTGESLDAQTIDWNTLTPVGNEGSGNDKFRRIVIKAPGVGGKIDLDPTKCQGKTLMPRLYKYCDDGVVKWVILVGSEVFV